MTDDGHEAMVKANDELVSHLEACEVCDPGCCCWCSVGASLVANPAAADRADVEAFHFSGGPQLIQELLAGEGE